MKKEVDKIDAVPSKRLFLSIIADYDLNRSISELIDNALDIWVKNGKSDLISVDVELDNTQQTIRFSDNAGGVKKSELSYIVGPGQTSNVPEDETIGIFGVGTKRAVVALAQDIRITTRQGKDKTHRVEFDDNWLENESWLLPVYEVDNIQEGTTLIELQRLRVNITDQIIDQLKEHLRATYARFLQNKKVIVRVNQEKLQPLTFENWAYPPSYPPQRYYGTLRTADAGLVNVEVIAGLISESSPASGEYGVYFYCNDRLIARALKSYDVGFTKGLAGKPHPQVSLTRVVVSLKGQARDMPWNSSKSDINTNHKVFMALRSFLVEGVVKDYASLSRRLLGEWPEKVFKFTTGKIVEHKIEDFPTAKKSYLPPLPRSKLHYGDIVKQDNRDIEKERPWTKGLYETVIAVDIIQKQNFGQKNRICLILLDSTIEIAFKEYLVNESGNQYNSSHLTKLFTNRSDVQEEIKKYIDLGSDMWKKIGYYYKLRCSLIHERATVGIHDDQIDNYREVVEKVLTKLFQLQFRIRV